MTYDKIQGTHPNGCNMPMSDSTWKISIFLILLYDFKSILKKEK